MRNVLDLTLPNGTRTPVLCGDDLAAGLATIWRPAWRQVAVIGDARTAALFGPAIEAALAPRVDRLLLASFAEGEAHKTRATKEALEDQLLEAGFDRGACIVAVGGGIALDVAGFVAGTYLRGIAHVNIATTLLAQVDAAIGGKTAVNTPRGKNLVGAFHQPRAVLLHHGALATLPVGELRNGWAEAIKHAVIADAALFAELERFAAQLGDAAPATALIPSEEILLRCVAIKSEVVTADEREAGYRQVLNFGHTIAHAIEAASDHAVAHGEAVALGMLVETRAAESLCGLDGALGQRLATLLASLGLPVRSNLPFARIAPQLKSDKKTRDGAVHCALPRKLGEMHPGEGRWALAVPTALLEQAWADVGFGMPAEQG